MSLGLLAPILLGTTVAAIPVPSPSEEPASAPLGLSPAPAPPALVDASSSAAPLERRAANLVFLEGFGSGLLYSLSYERYVESIDFGFRIGASYFTYPVSSYGKSGNLSLFTVPMMASWYGGWDTHKIQVGLGATLIYLDAATDSLGNAYGGDRAGVGLAASGYVGYRYLPRTHGITFGAGFSPLLRTSKFLPWGGANVGYVF